ncbi:MAG TPA: hypothetical protein VFD90_18940 [Gaiellales bacterium]|jgi:hypothetical protein|nr:hypothetical protein [Gaiellales bacterium]
MPALTWNPAKGAVQYEVQISSDAGFNPAVVDVNTSNLRFVNGKTLPNGAYFWRVRSIDKDNASSKWSGARKFTKKWNAVATLLSPASLTAIAYPSPAILTWSSVPGAVTYRVSVAGGASGGGVDAPGGIISNGALAWSSGGNPIETSNTNLAVSTALHPGTYYWQVVPVDAEGHTGAPSAILSFVWIWAGTTTPTVTDIVPGIEIYDPLFQWGPIPGAASYQIEINTTSGFATGSKVFSANTSATSFAPTQTLPNNTYYWRVRGVDPQGQAGPWNNGPQFDKTYDQTVAPGPANLKVLDSTLEPVSDGANVNEPVITWDPVPGARSYEVQTDCSPSGTSTYTTTNTAWTPFSNTSNPPPPLKFAATPGFSAQQETPLPNGNTCSVRVRAFTDYAIDGSSIAGLPATSTSFILGGQSFSNPPTTDCLSASCVGKLNSGLGDVISPDVAIVNSSPLLCWKPADTNPASGVTPSTGYWVAISRDFFFTTIVQAAYTDEPCYAPRSPLLDEGTLYYWQVVPTIGGAGGFSNLSGAAGRTGGFLASPSFQHASVPPTGIQPVGGASVSGPVLFQWNPVPRQVKHYSIEIAQDSSFSTILESATTDATAYAATQTYPVGATLYWRVRANNDDSKGLAWSGTSTFVQALPVPAITTPQAFTGETFPALTWNAVDGASSYEVQDVWPDASVHVTSNIPSTAVSYTKMTGTGHGTVQVRAVFGNGVKSAYTPARDVIHTIAEPGGSKTQLINKPNKLALTFAWNTKTNAKQYKVQVSRTPGFTQPFLDDTTDQASYTPLLSQQDFVDGGVMYWRVAVVDPDNNTGAFSKAKKFTLLARLQVQIGNQPAHGQSGVVTVTVTNAKGKPVKGASVKLKGPGVKTGGKRSSKKGIVTFSIKPSNTGNLTAIVTKKLFKVGSAVAQIS